MAGVQVGEAFLKLTADGSQFKERMSAAEYQAGLAAENVAKKWDETAKKLEQTGKKFESVGKSFNKYVTLPVVGGLSLATVAAGIQEQAEADLAAALKTTGDATEETTKRLHEFASSIQKTTIYGDEAILQGMAFAKQMGVQTDQLEDATTAAVGLAAKYNLELKTAFMLIGRAAAGNTGMLARYGIVLDENLSKEEKFAELLKIGAGAMGTAEDKAKTMAGRMQQMKNAVGDAMEVIGGTLIPYMTKFANIVKSLAERFQNLPQPIITVGVALAGLAAMIGPVLLMIAKVIQVTVNLHKMGLTLGVVTTRLAALRAVAATLFTPPGGLIALGVVAIGALVIALAHWAKAEDKTRSEMERTRLATESAQRAIDSYRASLERLSATQLTVYARNLEMRYTEARDRAQDLEAQHKRARWSPFVGIARTERLKTSAAEARAEADRLWDAWRAAADMSKSRAGSPEMDKNNALLEQQNEYMRDMRNMMNNQVGLYGN